MSTDGTEKYVYLELDGYDLEIHVKLDDEGVVVDAWLRNDPDYDDEIIASTYKFYSEMGIKITETGQTK